MGRSANGQRPNTDTKNISRKDFDALDPVERHRKVRKEGYRVFDEVIERRPKPAGTRGKTMSRVVSSIFRTFDLD
jgi:hypothetical protein